MRGLDFYYTYIDDLLGASSSPAKHKILLRCVFKRLSAYGLVIHPQKCRFGLSSIEFLGHVVDSSGIHPLRNKVQAILDFLEPKSRRQLCTSLGLINFYHRFIPGCAKILRPLNILLSSSYDHCKVFTMG